MERNRVIVITIVIAGIVLSSYLLWDYREPERSNPNLSSETGLNDGDNFRYQVTGDYNGSAVEGTWEVTRLSQGAWSFSSINTTSQELNQLLFGFSFINSGYQFGMGNLLTSFGEKEVVWTFWFQPLFSGYGVAIVNYFGVDPNVAYCYTLNGWDMHLELSLESTSNEMVRSGNTDPFYWENPYEDHTLEYEMGWENVSPGVITGWNFYSSDGMLLSFNLTAERADMFTFSQGNMISMAEGGPFAYSLQGTMVQSGNTTGMIDIHQGVYAIWFIEWGAVGGRLIFEVI